MPINLNVNHDALGVTNALSSLVHSNQDRSSFVKNLRNTAYERVHRRYNVMVFNLGQNYDERFNDVKFYGSARYQNLTFGIWVFEYGEFTNQGDGGFINWAFEGNWTRDDKYVRFNRI